jgi:PadR family transcriptional regulator, regulatory protein PadR
MMHDLSGFQRDLLYEIAGLANLIPPHGLAIKEELEQHYLDETYHGRLYPNLDSLVEKGVVEKSTIDKRTNGYEITNRGRRELEAGHEWERQYVELAE